MKAPLADRLRPDSLETMVGQRHLLAPGQALRNIIESGQIPNLICCGRLADFKYYNMDQALERALKVCQEIYKDKLCSFLFLKN